MTRAGCALVAALAILAARTAAAQEPAGAPRFRTLAVELEVGDAGLAAYQVEVVARGGAATIVGVEGGAAAGFTAPPYYDPAALRGGRIVLAAFDTKSSLKKGRHRVAVLHLLETGPAPAYAIRVIAAGGADGARVRIGAALVEAKGD